MTQPTFFHQLRSTIALHGVKLQVVSDTGSGTPIIFLHGIAASSAIWKHVLPAAAAHNRCITIDLLGFGASPAPTLASYTIDDQVNALVRAIKRLELKQPFTLVGHSMGSLIAARYAARYPKNLKKLVMVAPPIYVQPTELSNIFERAQMDFYLKAYKYIRENKNFTLHNASIIQKLLPVSESLAITEKNWTPFVKSLEQLIESQTTLNDIASVTAPMEVFYGTLDPLNHTGVMKIVDRMKGIEVHAVEGEGHVVSKKVAAAVVKALK